MDGFLMAVLSYSGYKGAVSVIFHWHSSCRSLACAHRSLRARLLFVDMVKWIAKRGWVSNTSGAQQKATRLVTSLRIPTTRRVEVKNHLSLQSRQAV